jgi:hypothetical protein
MCGLALGMDWLYKHFVNHGVAIKFSFYAFDFQIRTVARLIAKADAGYACSLAFAVDIVCLVCCNSAGFTMVDLF